MPSRERKRATFRRRIGTVTALLVASSLLFGALPANAATGPAGTAATSVAAAAAKTLTAPAPKITGTLQVGATLTAVVGTWGPAPVALTYSWLVGGVAKATTKTYKVAAADVGKTILVKVTGKKTGYTTLTKSSTATAVVVGTITPAPVPTISGTVKAGSTLTAVPGTWGPAPVTLTYAWSVGGVAKATTATYKIVAADAGKTILVKVTGKKAGYTTVTKSSAATAAVPAVIGTLTPAPTPTITGTVKVGSKLTAVPGTWGPAPVTLAYAWLVGGVAKATTATYTIAAADAGKTIVVKVTGTKTGYTTLAKTSPPTATVSTPVGTLTPAPIPTITGTVKVGSTLTAAPGTWGPAPVALAYSWLVGGTAKASTPTYTIDAADAGKTITVKVTGTKAGYTTLAKTSAATIAVPAVVATLTSAPTPTITGTVKVDSTLTAVPGSWAPAPVTLAYAWTVDGVAKASTPTYTIATADAGKTIQVKVTGTKAGYATLSRTSAATAAVPAVGAPVHITSDIIADTTWGLDATAVYVIDQDVTIAKGKTLTIPGGLVVKFAPSTRITVAGQLTTSGTIANPVIFTSLSDDAASGDTDGDTGLPTDSDWNGVSVTETGTATLAGTNIRYAAQLYSLGTFALRTSTLADSASGVESHGPTTIVDSSIDGGISSDRSSDYARRLDTMVITGNAITDGPLNVNNYNRSIGYVPIVVTGNTVTGVTGATSPIRVGDERLKPSNLTGNSASFNDVNAFAIGGELVEDWSVPSTGLPFLITGFTGGITVPTGKTMTVNAGTTLKQEEPSFDAAGGISVSGTLNLKGTSASPVILTSSRDDTAGGDTNVNGDENAPAAGDWNGILAEAGSSVSIANTEIRYGSGVDTYGTLTVASSRILETWGGLRGFGATTVTNSAIDGGLEVRRDSVYASRLNAIVVTGNTITRGPLRVDSRNTAATGVGMIVKDNTVTGLTGETYPVAVVDARLKPSNLTGNTATGNDVSVFAIAGTLIENWTVPTVGLPYVIGGIDFFEGLQVPSGITMTVNAGTVLKTTAQVINPMGISVDGTLKVIGTATSPVVFTSTRDDSVGGDTNVDGAEHLPEAGEWAGVTLGATGVFTATFLSMRYAAGISSDGSLALTSSQLVETPNGVHSTGSISVTNCTIDGGIDAARDSDFLSRLDKLTVTGTVVTDAPLRINSSNDSEGVVAMVVKNNAVSGIEERDYPINISDIRLVPANLTGNTATGNAITVFAISGTLISNWTVPATGLPFMIAGWGGNQSQAGLTVASGAVMTLNPGVILKVAEDNWWASHITVDGTLNVKGTATQPVTITAWNDDSIGGDSNADDGEFPPIVGSWSGVAVSEGGRFTATNLEIRYARASVGASASSEEDGTTVALDAVTLRLSSQCLALSGPVLGHFHGTVRDCEVGVSADYAFDATAVDWGDGQGPGVVPGERPTLGGYGASVLPWVGFVAPAAPVRPAAASLPVTQPTQCKDILFIGVRGSGETATFHNMGPTVNALAAAYEVFAGREATDKTVRTTGIEYPAYAVPLTEGATHGVDAYVEGAWRGTLELLWTIKEQQNRCGASGEKIVLGGYSQGAWVIHSALAYAEASGAIDLDSISGVGLVADPQRLAHAPETNLGSASDRSYGIANFAAIGSPLYGFSDWLARSAFADVREFALSSPTPSVMVTMHDLPGATQGVTAGLCDFKDPVCAQGDLLFPFTDKNVHSAYGSKLDMLALHLADLL